MTVAILRADCSVEQLNAMGKAQLPGGMGVEILSLAQGVLESRMAVTQRHMAPNGYLHAASVVALADTTCGYGSFAHLPNGARGFTTVELKTNFLGTVTQGAIACRAVAQHLGRTTQVWDASVSDETGGRVIALFRCTQMILWPGA
jgi:1,4-dihydroxy-2-naphthoyl-CoA hydrolase